MSRENDAAIANGCAAHITLASAKGADVCLSPLPTALDKYQPAPVCLTQAHAGENKGAQGLAPDAPATGSGKKPFLRSGSGLHRRQEAWRSAARYVPPGGFLLAPELPDGQEPLGAGPTQRPHTAPARPRQHMPGRAPLRGARDPNHASDPVQSGAAAPAAATRRGRSAAATGSAPGGSKAPSGGPLATEEWLDAGDERWGAGDAALVGDNGDLYAESEAVPLRQSVGAEDAQPGSDAGAAEWQGCADDDGEALRGSSVDEHAQAYEGLEPGGGGALGTYGDSSVSPAGAGLPLDGAWDARDVEEVRVTPIQMLCQRQGCGPEGSSHPLRGCALSVLRRFET